jgi:CubicO group peptidase (beta-lactamase class C family)
MILSDPATNSASDLPYAARRVLSPLAGSPGDFTWGGAAGTYFWVDPKEKMFVIYMMQAPGKRVPMRILLRDMVYAAMTE